MTSYRYRYALFITILLAGCTTALPEYNFTDDQAEQAARNWVNCEECTDDQLHHVVIVGQNAEQYLKAYLTDPARDYGRAAYAAELQSQHVNLKAAVPTLMISEDMWIAVHVQARENKIKSRAAHALHIINSRTLSRRELDAYRRVR